MAAANRAPVVESRPALGHRVCGPAPHPPAPRPAQPPVVVQSRRARDVCMCATAPPAKAETGDSLELSVLCATPAAPKAKEIMWGRLKEANVGPVTVEEMLEAQKGGASIVDVRPKKAYQEGHIPGSISIPLYDLIEGWSPFKISKRFGYLMFATIDGTEMQEDFLKICDEKCGREKGITLVCDKGFTIAANPEEYAGVATRSLIAGHELVFSNFKNVKILEKGIDMYVDEESGRELSKGKN